MSNTQPTLEIHTKAHDMSSNLVRVLVIIRNYAFGWCAPRAVVSDQFVKVRGVDSVTHIGKQSIELYVLQSDLSMALQHLGDEFSADLEPVDTRLLSVVFNGEPYSYPDFVSHIDQVIALDTMDNDRA